MKRIGIITSGGDAPGTNACTRTLARRCFAAGITPVGVFDSWDGLLKGSVRDLTRDDVTGIVQTAGTILRSSRSRLFLKPGDAEIARNALARHTIDGLIVIGGNGSQSAAALLAETGYPVVGVPKSIDNDLVGTEATVGFLTAVETATNALDNLRATAESHNRVMVLEVMGRASGWIAVEAAIAGGADLALIPEFPLTLDQICERLKTRHQTQGRNYSIIVVAEGASAGIAPRAPARGLGQWLAEAIEKRQGYDARCTTLGYLQRCAAPCAGDRILATRLSDCAFELLIGGKTGLMAALRGANVAAVPLRDAAGKTTGVTPDLYRLAEIFG